MPDQAKFTELEFHRIHAAGFFNQTWALLDKYPRSVEEDFRMIHLAHASRMHWEFVGNAANLAIGEWQIARVYSVLKRAEPALTHAQRSLQLVEQNAITGFQRGCAHEAVARALWVAGDKAAAAVHLARAQEIISQLADAEDKKVLSDDLATIPL